MSFSAVVWGLGNIGLLYDFEKDRPHPSSHIMAYESNKKFNLVFGIDIEKNKSGLLHKISSKAKFLVPSDLVYDHQKIDVVSVCTPPQYHLENIKSVIEIFSPKVIFCEKPLVRNPEEVELLKKIMQENPTILLVPNISRRWNKGLANITQFVDEKKYGNLEKIHIRYTRGIYNTGAHLFDLIYMWTGEKIKLVQTLKQVYSSSEKEGEKSYSFFFEQESGIYGYAEAMNDEHFYVFEVDLFFENGKVSMKNSGDDLYFYRVGKHHLFEGCRELIETEHWKNLLEDNCMKNAVEDIGIYFEKGIVPRCTADNAIYPLYVAEAIEKSFANDGRKEVVRNG